MKLLKENNNSSEDEADLGFNENDTVNPNDHLKLVKAISKLDKTQHIQKPSRDGYSDIKSEFHVSHSSKANNAVAVSDIINVLQKTSDHVNVSKKIKLTQNINKTLDKPIEKHEAEKIKRSTGFEDVKKSLGKWDAVVSRNRTVEHIKFPLNNEKVEQLKSKDYFSKFSIKSDLEKELQQLEVVEDNQEEDESTFPMTMNELIEHRKEVARLRAKQSYQEAKARRQKKIKSKKFHRIQRKEKIKQQLKDFEQLQKTDPEEALRKLEQLEKTRAQERVSLRHKSTGQWAKNKLVRAKYDKETRQQLAEQLAISKELTQKQKLEETESEEENDVNQEAFEQDSSNPWLSRSQPSQDVTDFVSGYKKYWEERNKSQASLENKDAEERDVKNEVSKTVKNISVHEKYEKQTTSENADSLHHTDNTPLSTKGKNTAKKVKSTSTWVVEEIHKKIKPTHIKESKAESKSLDEIFDEAEWKLEKSLKNKLHKMKTDKKSKVTHRVYTSENAGKEDEDDYLGFKKQKLRPEIDEELNETSFGAKETSQSNNADLLKTDLPSVNPENQTAVTYKDKIDPEKFVAIKRKHLMSTLPDIETEGDMLDDDDDDERKLTIAEAFEDDDIVAEFHKDKENEINKDKPQVEDLELPGWGSWVGKNMKNCKRRRRMILKPPEVIPRKDDKKDNVMINENKGAKLRAHQVSELPFPFTRVSDFEASIRAPIGNTFIPESAHRKLVKPPVIVKRGLVIEPMDESQLIDKKKTKLSMKNGDDSAYDKPLFRIAKSKNAQPRVK